MRHAIQEYGTNLLDDGRLRFADAPLQTAASEDDEPAKRMPQAAALQPPAQLRCIAQQAKRGQYADLSDLAQAVQGALGHVQANAAHLLRKRGPSFRWV